MLPKISIIVPIYGVEKFLEQVLDSILAQTLTDIEIICINDGAKDKCPEITKRYAKKDKRIVAIYKENEGYGKTLNLGISLAKGEYIGIVEPDDWIEPTMYEKLYQMAKQYDVNIAGCSYYSVSNHSERDVGYFLGKLDTNITTAIYLPNDTDAWIYKERAALWSKIYRTNFLRQNNIKCLETPGASYQDVSFTYKVNIHTDAVAFIHEPLYHYREARPQSSIVETGKTDEINAELRECWEQIKTSPHRRKIEPYFLRYLADNYHWNYDVRLKTYENRDKLLFGASALIQEVLFSKNFNKSQLTHDDFCWLLSIAFSYSTSSNPIKVSVIVPVYNVEKYIDKCMQSLIGQTLKDIEIICIDDCGTDNSFKIVEKYAKKDARIKTIKHEKNGGLSMARNTGMSVAKGQYIMFCDSDDYYDETMCEKMYSAIVEKHVGEVVCGVNVKGQSTKRFGKIIKDLEEYYTLKYYGLIRYPVASKPSQVSVWVRIFNRELLNYLHLTFLDGLFYEDYHFSICYEVFLHSALYIEEKLYNYVIREGSIIENTAQLEVNFTAEKGQAEQHIDSALAIFDFCANKGVEPPDPQRYLFDAKNFVESNLRKDRLLSALKRTDAFRVKCHSPGEDFRAKKIKFNPFFKLTFEASKSGTKIKLKLFGFIPLIKISNIQTPCGSKKKVKLFGITIFKTYIKDIL